MSNFYNQASWVLVPSGIEEDIVFAQKPISGLGDLTFTRSSDATYTDASGVVRRSPYNLLTWSEDFTNAVWIKQEVTISSNVAIAPNGTQSADKITPSTLNTVHQIRMDSVVSASQCSFGVFAKADGYSTIEILDRISATDGAIFNLSNGTFTNKGSGIGKIENYGNGWYRCTVTANTTGIRIYVPSSSSIAGNGTSGVLLWGAQLVEGTSALDYFPTTNRQDVPRIDFRNADGTLSSCGRLLLEPQRTNSIRNSSMVGAIAGSPGTLPTNWGDANTAGLSREIVGVGVESGLPYVDFRVFGTCNSTTSRLLSFELINQVVASSGQVWTTSLWAKIISAPNPPSAYEFGLRTANAAGTPIGFIVSALSLTSSLRRVSTVSSALGATVERVQPLIALSVTNGATYDFTIRIAAPQMELGAYATTWIPTTTAAVTRLADTASKTGVSSLIGQTEGTLFFDFELISTNQSNTRIFTINDTTGSNVIRTEIYQLSSTVFQFRTGVTTAGVDQGDSFTTITQLRNKIAISYGLNDVKIYINGSLVATDTTVNIPATSALFLANRSNISSFCAVSFAQYAIFPTRLTNAQLEQLTTL